MINRILTCILLLTVLGVSGQEIVPPAAEKIPHYTFVHKDTLTDHYFWMRDKYSAEMVNYLYANNAYSDAVMKPTALLQKVIYDEMRSRIVESRDTRPSKNKNYYYYTRTTRDKDYPAIYRKKDSLTAPEQLVLDMNKLAEQYLYFALRVSSMSPDQSMFAYGVDDKGNNVSKLYIRHIDGDSLLSTDTIPAVLGFMWAEDNRTFYYTVPENKTLRAWRVYRHRLGNSYLDDELVLEEPDPTFQVSLGKTSSKEFITFSVSKTRSNEVHYLSAHQPDARPVLYLKRSPGMLYSINHYDGNEFYIQTNHKALNYRYVRSPIGNRDPEKWETVIPHRRNILLEHVSLTKDFIIYDEKENAQDRVIVRNRHTGQTDTIDPGLAIYAISWSYEEYDYHKTRSILYSAGNDIEPTATYRYDLYTRMKELVERDSLNGPYVSSQYETRRIYATSHDGVAVPVTITYKKGMIQNGNNPVLLTGYGSYGAPNPPAFSAPDLSFLNRGFILATAHIRGSNDLGMSWYENGKMLNKKNTFLDFIACAEHLVQQKYTNPGRLAIQGGSAGGLLMGAVVNMRPDLFKCVVANVPFVDVMNTMLDESIPLTTFEYEEWGDPRQKKYYDYMKSYSPYDNVERKAYPNMLVTAGYNDAQVGCWEPAKWVARLREYKTDTNAILFKTNMEGGHGGASGRYAALKERAFQLAYIMSQLGVKENYITLKGKVVNMNNDPVEYANIYIESSGVGTNSNSEGEFSMRLKSTENVTIVVQSIGYEKYKIKLDMNTRTSDLLIRLRSDNVLLKTAMVTADGRDPAIGIMRNAIRMRKENYDRVKSFSADVYMKSHVKLNEIPKKMPAILKLATDEKIDSSYLGLVYLSESVAKYHFEKPDKVKETMIASRIAGQKQGFSFNRVEDVFINFYQPTVQLAYYSERPFVSPLAPLAALSYRYRYKGTFEVDGKDVYKIEVTPLRKGDPLFRGFVYISQDHYQVYGVDLFITKDAQIDFVDTLFLQQEMVNEGGTYMPLQLKLYSYIKVFGFRATDLSVANMSNYRVNTDYGKKFFSYEVFNIEKGANKKDTQYWSTTRTIVLTDEEQTHYRKSDSIYAARNTPEFLDSMDRKRNRFRPTSLLFGGYTYSRSSDSTRLFFNMSTIPFSFGYNTVEGAFINYRLSWYRSELSTRKYVYIAPVIRYGFANRNLSGGLTFVRSLNPRTNTSLAVTAGSFIHQYNQAEPINPFINTAYTLFDRLNYAKLLQKEMLSATISHELLNGVYMQANAQWQNRVALTNHAHYAFIDESKRSFTSNNPLDPLNDAPAFVTHQTVEYRIGMRYVPKQRYETYPAYKRILGSRYPDLYASFKHGIGISGLSFNYQLLEAGTGKDIDLKLLGELSFDVNAGTFFNTASMPFADHKHFNGNQTFILHNPGNRNSIGDNSRQRLTSFHALNYYSLSTNGNFLEVHVKQDFRSFFIGKLPLLRKTKAYELAGLNYLLSGNTSYTELYLGLDHIFSVLRVDAGRVISNNLSNSWFFRFGLELGF